MIGVPPSLALRSVVLFAVLFAGVPVHAVPPVVSNVSAQQERTLTGNGWVGGKVNIWYDLADPDSPTVRVSLLVSSDAGSTWAVPVQTFVGSGFGPSVQPGIRK